MAIAAVILAVGTAQAGDLITFVRMIRNEGSAAEANPIVAHGLDSVGLPALVFAKMALFVLVVAIVTVLAHAGVEGLNGPPPSWRRSPSSPASSAPSATSSRWPDAEPHGFPTALCRCKAAESRLQLPKACR